MSSRTIWNNVINRCDFIFLAAGQVPDFRTIHNFRKRHLAQLPNIFAQIVMYCKELDTIGFKHLEEIADEKKRINLTDPNAPVMRHKDGRGRSSYNHQTARDHKCGVVTAVETRNKFVK